MAQSLEKDTTQQSGSRFGHKSVSGAAEPAAPFVPHPPVATTTWGMTEAELDEIAAELEALLEERGGILIF